jgi:hypothetical protein
MLTDMPGAVTCCITLLLVRGARQSRTGIALPEQ